MSGPDEQDLTSALFTERPETRVVRPSGESAAREPALPEPGPDSVLEQPGDSDSEPGSGSDSRSDSGRGSGPRSDSRSGSQGTGGETFPRGSRRSSSRGSRRSRRGALGAGLVEVPPVPYRDPSSAVLDDPVVAEHKRYCARCDAKVGRGSDGEPGPTEGTCANCGAAYSFTPRLRPNEVVGGQYEVLGALAYGGLGWIYLATDRNVNDRWVVLKGLIDTGDATATEAAVNETRFLAEVEHPNIVKIYNFVKHEDPRTGHSVGYIVMEYVGGQSLRQLALARHRAAGRPESMPIGQVIAYGLEILPALGYLHNKGLLYCDLKPDNVIQTNEQLKLIDLGAVRHMDDYTSPLFFTSGYSAPELGTRGASVQSDLFTVGRTLAVLSFEFSGYTTKYKTTLPPQENVPLFQLFDSYYRFLKRATHADPDRRFASAEEMADQLTGVLREVMALGTGEERPGSSTVFGAENRTFGVHSVVPDRTPGRRGAVRVPAPEPHDVVAGLPSPLVHTDDVAASLLASTTTSEPREVIEALARAPQDSIEVRLRVVRARIELDELDEARRQLQAAQYLAVKAGMPHDWRIEWYRGMIELVAGRPKLARTAFDAAYNDVPGELAPKLALAACAELLGDYFAAARFYEQVWRTDRSYVSAAFGLARVYLAQGGRDIAVETLDAIPRSSSHHVDAQINAVRITASVPPAGRQQPVVTAHELVAASRRLEGLDLDAERRAWASADLLEATYGWMQEWQRIEPAHAHDTVWAHGEVLGSGLSERDVRFGLERCYRWLARLAGTSDERIDLVDRANDIRPRTLT
ncbi:serine/threonine-protein kinase PknG [Haloechinothrix alba]|uniref:non-specific serine/threonine protein kinase n=1 Tax=Haloechinothrix alba TaxID=664784 RepID=A0A238W4T6_9PSEU|nr:serine/threonine-protein kinase [Haloechinothrix alba]SNR41570.1 serine/threonine-protein kinase PknG [Haloechinothrix alba]